MIVLRRFMEPISFSSSEISGGWNVQIGSRKTSPQTHHIRLFTPLLLVFHLLLSYLHSFIFSYFLKKTHCYDLKYLHIFLENLFNIFLYSFCVHQSDWDLIIRDLYQKVCKYVCVCMAVKVGVRLHTLDVCFPYVC